MKYQYAKTNIEVCLFITSLQLLVSDIV